MDERDDQASPKEDDAMNLNSSGALERGLWGSSIVGSLNRGFPRGRVRDFCVKLDTIKLDSDDLVVRDSLRVLMRGQDTSG
jgi:hypothetical protein